MYYNKKEAADALGVSRPTIYSWLADGTLQEDELGIPEQSLVEVARMRVAEAAGELLHRQDIALRLRDTNLNVYLGAYEYRMIIEGVLNENG